MSDYIPSARGDFSLSNGIVSTSESMLYGALQTVNNDIVFQRLSYVFLHAYLLDRKTMNGYDTMSDMTMGRRLDIQRKLVDAFLEVWYNPEVESSMLGGKDGAPARYEQASRKPQRALSRLKSKGYYADTYEALVLKMDNMFGARLVVSYTAYLAMAAGTTWRHESFTLSDDVWLSAIELTMILTKPNVYFNPADDSQWIRHLEENIPLLLTFVYFIASCGFYALFCIEHEELLQRVHDAESEADSLSVQLASVSTETGSFVQKCADEVSAAEKKFREQTKANLALQRENQMLRNKLEKLERQLQSVQSASVPDDTVDDSDDTIVDDGDAGSELETFLLDLPESNVLFIGGHPNMLSKLMPRFPKWKFVSEEVSASAIPKDIRPDFVFIWSNHMSHSLTDRLKSLYNDKRIGYCKATNIELLITEMQTLYTDAEMKSESGD